MRKKTYANLLLFALLGITLWFFGNLYEAIVLAPNLLQDPIKKIYHWQHFFTIANPIFFYIPLAPMAIVTVFVLYFNTSRERTVLKRHVAYATIFLIFALVLGIYIITQINLKLFFGNMEKLSGHEYKLSVLCN